ncbi:hypothetical protein HF325_006246 [Metschnikowia pulcherrima]|uniref:RRM domain-containing protein n=1 Tax=Metschnikowia pulcherrima TaxID=27326 RepID=A0A8H7GLB6_9ASCO|nr:hypothetical protein HF325_006246 [Metschnikowia pulcherrima]
MDLHNLSSTPSQLDSVIQRRPSLSSLSSTSGYDSSTYNAAPTLAAGTASALQMAHMRTSTGPSRMYPGLLDDPIHTGLGGDNSQPLSTDVGPWVEQQKQQQSLNVDAADLRKKDVALKPSLRSNVDDLTFSVDNDDDDDLIPTAIVIKNIPFAIKKEQLLDVMTKLSLPLPYAFNYHFDNGVFRGLAFANFASTDETSMVVNQLNGREIGGRKLRVEYKKMLPLQERERIEREKREKRGQLEEQHRTGSNASLALLLSVTSTTAATKNLSVSGQTFTLQTERFFSQFPSASNNIPMPPSELNFNDPEILELYSQLLTYRDDNLKLIFELAFPPSLNLSQRKVLSLVCSFLNLLELFDNGLIIIRRKPGQQSIQQRQQQTATYNTHLHPQASTANSAAPQAQAAVTQMAPAALNNVVQNGHSLHSSLMMNLSQMPALLYPNNLVGANGQPELLRSQSQSALPLASTRHISSSGSQLQKAPQGKYQNYGGFGGGSAASSSQQQGQMGTPTSSSAAALLRTSNNRSFVDVRSTPSMGQQFQGSSAAGSPTPLHHANLYQQPGHYYMGGQSSQVSQPTTPHQASDLSNRFAPFGQHAHLNSSITSLQGSASGNDEYGLNDPLNAKFNNLNLNQGYEQQKGGGIWGHRN